MYPTLSYLIEDFTGLSLNIPFPTFGFMVSMGFIAAALVMVRELKRLEKEGVIEAREKEITIGVPASISDLAGQAILGFVIGFKLIGLILDYETFSINPQDYVLSSQGSWIAGIVVAGLAAYVKYREKQKELLTVPEKKIISIPPFEEVGDITVVAMISGLLGAKLFFFFEDPERLFVNPFQDFFSGLTYYGGLITGIVVVLWHANKRGIKPRIMLDVGAPALMISYAIGRIGCQLSGDGDWGIVNTIPQPEVLSFLPSWMWSFTFPHNVNNVGVLIPGCVGNYCGVLPEGVWPTAFYETVMCTFAFGILWAVRKKFTVPGMLFSLYLILNGVERFTIEKIRVNANFHFLGMELTQAEIISSIMVVLGIAGLIYLRKQAKT